MVGLLTPELAYTRPSRLGDHGSPATMALKRLGLSS